MAVRYLLLLFIVFSQSPLLFSQVVPPGFSELPSKPLQFVHVIDEPEVSSETLSRLFDVQLNDSILISLHPTLTFYGVVTARQVSLNRASVNFKLNTSPQLLFTITRFEEAGLQHYAGRLIHPAVGDALVLRESRNKYYFTRILTNKLLVE